MPPHDSETAEWFAREVQPREPLLRNYVARLAAPEEVDDIVQECYARLLRLREREAVRSPSGLLFFLARHAARDVRRRQSRTAGADESGIEEIADAQPGAAEAASRSQEIQLLTAAIEALPSRCRAVLLLRRFEHLSQREIAARLNISEHTVEVHLRNALKQCQRFFTARGAMPGGKQP